MTDDLAGTDPETGLPEPEATPVAPDDLATPQFGLEPRAQASKRVIVIGAGMAGLVAAFELARQGHDPIVLEAQNRVGGRVYTMRSFAPGPLRRGRRDADPAGPRPDARVLRPLRARAPAVRHGQPEGARPHRRPADDRRGGGAASRSACRSSWPSTSAAGPSASSGRRRRATCAQLLEEEGEAGWAEIVRQYDQYSLREFLVYKGFSEGAIEMYGVLNFVESDMNNAVIEELREDLGKAFVDMQEIVGGMDRLPNAFYAPARRPDPVRRGGPRDRPGPGLGDDPLQDRGRPVLGDRRLRDLRDPVLGPAPRRRAEAVLAREAAGDPAAQLLGVDEDPLPGRASGSGRPTTGSSAGRP